jgi:hypothetical protein
VGQQAGKIQAIPDFTPAPHLVYAFYVDDVFGSGHYDYPGDGNDYCRLRLACLTSTEI